MRSGLQCLALQSAATGGWFQRQSGGGANRLEPLGLSSDLGMGRLLPMKLPYDCGNKHPASSSYFRLLFGYQGFDPSPPKPVVD